MSIELPLKQPPESVCVIRLSAIGDVCHTLPVVRAMQKAWPETRITWIIGKLEARLLGDIPGIRFIVYDKNNERSSHRVIQQTIDGERFDVVLHMQAAFRASLICRRLKADVKLGFDRIRARDYQWLFTSHRIPAVEQQHVQDALFEFTRQLGIDHGEPEWNIPVSAEDHAFVDAHVPGDQPLLVISPCSSHELRNWRSEHYAKVANYAAEQLDYRIVIAGGPSQLERRYADEILSALQQSAIDLVGKDTLKQLLVLLQRADVVITPDSGPAHMANAVGTPVLGLYAASNPRRTGPYHSIDWCVDRYAEAARQFLGKPAESLRWGTKIEKEGVMDLIEPDAVMEKLEQLTSRIRSEHLAADTT